MEGQLQQQLSLDDFLDLRCPTGEAAGPADSKESFLAKLGLDDTLYTHKQVFDKMTHEAEAALQTALARQNFRSFFLVSVHLELRPALADHAMLQAVKQYIYRTASPQTKFMYDLVRDGNGKCWAIDWILWQAMKSQVKSSTAQHEANGIQQTGNQDKLSGDSKSRRSPTAENDLVEITEAEFRMQAGKEGSNEAQASRTTPAKVMEGPHRDSVTSEGSPDVRIPMSVQHLLNAQDDDLS